MMKTYAIAALLGMITMVPAVSAAEQTQETTQQKGEVIHIGVNGMVCDFCAQSLKKVFLKQDAVRDIDVSLEKKLVTVYVKQDKALDDTTIKKLIVDAGYNVENIHHMKAE